MRWTEETKAAKKAEIIATVRAGGVETKTQLAKMHGLAPNTLITWLDQDVEFRAAAMGTVGGTSYTPTAPHRQKEVPDFETFRRDCFGNETYRHQREWVRVLEQNDLSLVLVPPEHAKTMTLSIEYATWRVVSDRNIRIIIVSKAQTMSRKILGAIQKRLVDHAWYQRQGLVSVPKRWGPFAPQGRLQGTWNKDMFYVTGIDSGEKDPTVEALGVGGQIYGARADLIICDDIATLKNQASPVEREKMLDWLLQECLTRLSDDGKLLIVGTRVNEEDIYGTILDEEVEWAQDFFKVVHPAIQDEERGEVLWPEYWPLEKLITKRRNRMTTRQWNLVYQQSAVGAEDSPFSPESVEACKDVRFSVGQHLEGLPIVVGVDPALTGTLAISVVGYDRSTRERWLVDCQGHNGVRHPDLVKSKIVEACARYGALRCRIEKNAMQGFLSRDSDLRRKLSDLGCQLQEEYTGMQNKYDPDWGVGSIAGQFDEGLWHIPWTPHSQGRMRPLLDELLSWRPLSGRQIKQDRVMSLWLADLSARELGAYGQNLPGAYRPAPRWVRKREVPSWVRQTAGRQKVSTFTTPGDEA